MYNPHMSNTSTLSTKSKQILKGQAHSLNPVVTIGVKGLTANVINEIDVALEAHQLIKIKCAKLEKSQHQKLVDTICEQCNAQFIQAIGNIIVIYRKRIST
ncbi:MAG: ribosome assembly RNA-binding protein YhbY [Gammaproteobacteria bacterium]